ncbi:MAG TPA: choice-of-anchor B family protein [Bacteroidia bacterium]
MKRILTLCFTAIAALAFSQNMNVTFRANMTFPGQTLANICGYVDSQGNEYALCGGSQGLIIVDVTNPSNPVLKVTVPEVNNLWKEIKVYGNYAYVTTEGGGGLHIIDLSPLPNTTLPSHYYTGDGAIAGQLNKVHALHIDTTKKFIYLFGGDLNPGGAIALDINVDPYNPTYAGRYSANYIHDGYVDNDTLYGAHIYQGYFSVINFANKTSPQVLQTQNTPGNFTHNTWPSNDKKYLFTTDEVSNSYLSSYDISNLNNITLLDKIQSNPGSNSIVHNTHILNNWAITSWYRDGITIVDVTRPNNLIQVGNYDTYPAGSGSGYDGAWGVYPFLPSGTIVVSNINEGLFVLTPNYVRACYLEGTAIDSVTTLPLYRVNVNISTVNVMDSSDANGIYRTGTAIPGTYNITYTKSGYYPLTWSGRVFTPGNVVNILAKMVAVGTNTAQELYSGKIEKIFPNPFNGNTQLQYVLDPRGSAKLVLMDVTGRVVQEKELAGSDGTISIGEGLTAGIYFAQIKQRSFVSTPVKIIKN